MLFRIHYWRIKWNFDFSRTTVPTIVRVLFVRQYNTVQYDIIVGTVQKEQYRTVRCKT